MSEETKVEKLQWIKGDKQGSIEIVKERGGDWTIFESGGRINNTLLNEYMILIQNDNEILNFEDVKASLPKGTPVKIPTRKKTSPILTLLERMEDFDELELNLKVKIKVPKIDVMNLLSSTFGEKDFIDDLEVFVNEQAKEKNMNEILRKEIEFLLEQLK